MSSFMNENMANVVKMFKYSLLILDLLEFCALSIDDTVDLRISF